MNREKLWLDVNVSEKHIMQLDGVSGLAILLVLIVHAYYRGPSLGLDADDFSKIIFDILYLVG